MKKRNIYKGLLTSAFALVMLGTTSCDDFLTIHPFNKITEEEFWEDQNDLQSAVRGCYKQFIGSGIMSKLVIWGECRSDNFDLLSENWDDMKDLMNANLLQTNSLFSWADFYKDINFCNKVLEYGPKVIDRDASFTTEDWKPIEAEMKALRALNMFYLVRTFRDVPLDFKSIGTDREARAHSGRQIAAEVVLDSIINDVDRIKDNGMRRYSSTAEDKGRFTRESIYTLLADMYLWRAAKNASTDSVAKYGNQSQEDYQKVITLCDAVLDMYLTRYKEENPQYNQSSAANQDNPYFLIRMRSSNGSTKNVSDEIYSKIFIDGNSSESIFELQFDGNSNKNTPIYSYRDKVGLYCAESSNAGLLQAASPLQAVSKAIDNTNGVYSQTDMRRWENMRYTEAGQRVFQIAKYCQTTPEFTNLNDNSEGAKSSRSSTSSFRSNWIVYRLSDVLLMKAEAISRLEAPTDEQIESAFNNVTMILYRSNPTVTSESDKLKLNDYSTPSQLFSLVMRERRREFFGEGKRWFDLVRLAEYDGKTSNMLNLLLSKYATNTNAVKAKLSSMNSLYSPVYEDEMKVNPLLHQNPAWEKEQTISRN